jgi:hypothetical protein
MGNLLTDLRAGICTHVSPRRHHHWSSSPSTDTFSGHSGTATPTTAGPAAAATATERSQDAAAVEEAALSAERTQRRFAPTCHPCFNRTSGFSQSSPMPTATNGQTSPVPPLLNGLEESHSSSTPARQRDCQMSSLKRLLSR